MNITREGQAASLPGCLAETGTEVPRIKRTHHTRHDSQQMLASQPACLQGILREKGTELLCEVHEHYTMQKRLAERGFWVYDFALPMLCLQVWMRCPSVAARAVRWQCKQHHGVAADPDTLHTTR